MTQQLQDAYIVSACRTPVGKAKGILKHVRPDDLLAHVIRGIVEQNPNIDLNDIDDVIIGCAMPEAEQGMNVARVSSLLAGLPDSVPAMTINRFCSSGLQTIAMAADQIALGRASMVIAGGTESMSMVPMGGNKFSANPAFFVENEKHGDIAYSMGITAEIVAKKWDISRQQQDEFALESHRRALKAIENGDFSDEILTTYVSESVADFATGEPKMTSQAVQQDQGPRAGGNLESLAKLRSVFAAKGTVTAANTSQMSDGAGALLVVNKEMLDKYKLQPLARFVGFAVAGIEPEIMGVGPIKAIPKVLEQTGLNIADMDWIELNEAFASQSLAVIKELKLDPAKVNPLGGAIALGHPLGATGAIRTVTLLHGLRRNKLRYGMVTMCIGTGMGAAGIFESISS